MLSPTVRARTALLATALSAILLVPAAAALTADPASAPDPTASPDPPPGILAQVAALERANSDLRAQIARERERAATVMTKAKLRHRDRVRAARRAASDESDVDHALRLAAASYGVDEGRLRDVATCESGLRPYADGGIYLGLFQFGSPLWSTTPYRAFDRTDPYASALAASWAISRGMSSHWPVCGR
jgi:soluble lytic murein transglycosylase-like protein